MDKIKTLHNLPPRQAEDHKGKFGRVVVVAGSPGMSGAGCLAALGAQMAGAGLITLALPEGLALAGELFRASIMSKPLKESDSGGISLLAVPQVDKLSQNADVCALGPGLGREEETKEAVEIWVRELETTLVIDADGLNALIGKKEILKDRPAPTVITPHPGEMARLAGFENAENVQGDRTGTAAAFAREHEVVTVLKGHNTVVSDGDRLYVNQSGNPGMATGGTGDVLTGVTAALIGAGMEPFEAACLATFAHGLAGDAAAARRGMTSMAPEDILEAMPEVFSLLEGLGEQFEPRAAAEELKSSVDGKKK